MMLMNGEEYLTAEEAREVLGVKTTTLYAYVSRGVLSSYRQGIKRQRLYKKSQVDELIGLRPGGAVELQPSSPASNAAAPNETDEGSQVPLAESWIPYI